MCLFKCPHCEREFTEKKQTSCVLTDGYPCYWNRNHIGTAVCDGCSTLGKTISDNVYNAIKPDNFPTAQQVRDAQAARQRIAGN